MIQYMNCGGVGRILGDNMGFWMSKSYGRSDSTINRSLVEDSYTNSSMNFNVLKKEYFNETGELVLKSRSSIIERY